MSTLRLNTYDVFRQIYFCTSFKVINITNRLHCFGVENSRESIKMENEIGKMEERGCVLCDSTYMISDMYYFKPVKANSSELLQKLR